MNTPHSKSFNANEKYTISEKQSIELLKELHILTREGKLNQDSRRKLKQVYHLVQFIEPLVTQVLETQEEMTLVDFGAGKSYLGFILYDLVIKELKKPSLVIGIEIRQDLIEHSLELAKRLGFEGMQFLLMDTQQTTAKTFQLPTQVDIVTALHACDTATDDAIQFGIQHQAKHLVLVPCCQAEIAALLRKDKNQMLKNTFFAQMWRHPIHTREFGSHLTNVLRGLQLEAHGYDVNFTELVGWEHSLKNELIIASRSKNLQKASKALTQLLSLLQAIGLSSLTEKFTYALPQ